MTESVSPSTNAPVSRSPLPWVLLTLFLIWLGALIWMARGEFRARPKHERERDVAPLERGGA